MQAFLSVPSSDLGFPCVQLGLRRVVWTICSTGTCKVFIGGDLPGLFKLGHHRIRAGWLGTSVREPSVPDRFDLGAVVVGLLKVNPALTTGLLLIIFPVCVAIAARRQFRSREHPHTCQGLPYDPTWHRRYIACHASTWQSRHF